MRVFHIQSTQQTGVGGDGLRPVILRIVVMGIAVFLAVTIVPGIESDSLGAGLAAVLVLTLLNAVIRPLLYLLSMPLILVTLGLFMVLINALLLQVAAAIVKGFTVTGFWPSFWGALVISIASSILNMVLAVEHQRGESLHQPRRPPTIINPE